MNYKASQSDCWEQALLWTSINATLCQLLSFCEVISQFWVISSHAHVDPCGYMYFSLYVTLSPVPLPTDFIHHQSHILSPTSSVQGDHCMLPGFYCLHHCLKTFSRPWDWPRAGLSCLLANTQACCFCCLTPLSWKTFISTVSFVLWLFQVKVKSNPYYTMFIRSRSIIFQFQVQMSRPPIRLATNLPSFFSSCHHLLNPFYNPFISALPVCNHFLIICILVLSSHSWLDNFIHHRRLLASQKLCAWHIIIAPQISVE